MEEILLVVLGLIIGSFLNVVIHRLPGKQSLIKPASHCPGCNTPVKPYDNIPVLSYLLLGGKCRFCKIRISPRYPIVEAFTGFIFWLSYVMYAPNYVHVGFTILFLCLLLVLALIDLEHMILPNELNLIGAVIFLGYSFFHPQITWQSGFIAGLGGAFSFIAILYLYKLIRKKDGMGWGDIKMMPLLGAFLGVNKLVIAVFLSSFIGSILGILLMLIKKKGMQDPIPFGTLLAMGSFIAVFWGTQILLYIQNFYK